jgi:hypothetical protein
MAVRRRDSLRTRPRTSPSRIGAPEATGRGSPGRAEELLTEVVELEDHDVGLAAVDARMSTQVIDDELHPLLADAFLRAPALSTYRCLLAA